MEDYGDRNPYTVIILDNDGFAYRMFYVEVKNFNHAFDRGLRKVRGEEYISLTTCGLFVQRASAEIIAKFLDKSINAKPKNLTEIETHLYAPKHLRR